MTTALVAASVMLLAQAGAVCDAAGPRDAVVEGRIVSKSGTPLPGVQVEATIAGSGRNVTAVSDPNGRYALSGLDVGADVELNYRDVTGGISAGCWVRTAPGKTKRSVDVVLDDFRPTEVTPSVGCQDVSPNDSWVTVGDRRRIVVGDLDTLHPPPLTTQPVPRLALRAVDIEAAQPHEDTFIVRLAPAGRHALAEFTEEHVGRVIVITIDGFIASARATVQAPIPSGLMTIDRWSLRGRLCEILRSAPPFDTAQSSGR